MQRENREQEGERATKGLQLSSMGMVFVARVKFLLFIGLFGARLVAWAGDSETRSERGCRVKQMTIVKRTRKR